MELSQEENWALAHEHGNLFLSSSPSEVNSNEIQESSSLEISIPMENLRMDEKLEEDKSKTSHRMTRPRGKAKNDHDDESYAEFAAGIERGNAMRGHSKGRKRSVTPKRSPAARSRSKTSATRNRSKAGRKGSPSPKTRRTPSRSRSKAGRKRSTPRQGRSKSRGRSTSRGRRS